MKIRFIENRKRAYKPRPKRRGQTAWNKGIPNPLVAARNKAVIFKGENNHRWKGGISPIANKIRNSIEGRNWKKEVLERDKHACIWCGSTERLHIDHIKPFALFPKLRTVVGNGRTLCYDCHVKSKHFCRSCSAKIN